MAVCVCGTFLCLRAATAQMPKNGGGKIINLSLVAGLIGFPDLSPYVASRHAVNGLTRNAALEYGQRGIRLNAIRPGGIQTRMLDSLAQQSTRGSMTTQDLMNPLHPIGRIGTPEEVVGLIVWLRSLCSPFATGAILPIGGYVAQ